jgi:hypothetical protein
MTTENLCDTELDIFFPPSSISLYSLPELEREKILLDRYTARQERNLVAKEPTLSAAETRKSGRKMNGLFLSLRSLTLTLFL